MIRRLTVFKLPPVLMAVAALACGGGSPTGPGPTPTPIATPTPAPEPTPTPTPEPTPTPCIYGLCEAPTTNTNPVLTAFLKVYTVQDELHVWIPNFDPAKPIKVGYTVKLDLTGKDAYNKDTLGERGVEIEFFCSNPSLVEVGGSSDWQPKLEVKQPGVLEVYAVYDGVRSNSLKLRFE